MLHSNSEGPVQVLALVDDSQVNAAALSLCFYTQKGLHALGWRFKRLRNQILETRTL